MCIPSDFSAPASALIRRGAVPRSIEFAGTRLAAPRLNPGVALVKVLGGGWQSTLWS
jgi:hypothetical protein